MRFEHFKLVLRTGMDLDTQHPQFGPFLEVMPWPVLESMADHDVRTI